MDLQNLVGSKMNKFQKILLMAIAVAIVSFLYSIFISSRISNELLDSSIGAILNVVTILIIYNLTK